ncbi:Restriction modification system DNA specificity domain [Thermobacillus xylanilyticus]|uniref:Restriction modification system DNA specificity domain n=1 Tax=Thermobacillus xylanilyticus TaxID=76633 RepID=A0ABN7S4P2_THEXY|nr:restriction endonuclease subunit S [Thermobacillus xylanilyticus]CAG5089476.1 Restriction modification system DNA specificity domain [Thermobacillus xylanilyticus]
MTHHQYAAKYKESEIEWIGSIPEHWSVVPLFSVLHERQVKNNDNQVTNVLSLSYGKIVPRDVESNYGLLPESFTTYQIVEPGNIILRLTDLQNDKRSLRVGLVKELGIITSAYLCLESVKAIDPDYAYYLLHSYDIIKVFYNLGGGVRQSIKFEDIKRLPIICPPLEEQRSIVSFLDQQTAKLDELVEKKQRLIDLLQEKRQALITQAVTKGLNPNVPMKDSGIEWLGEVPAHWEVCKLNFRYSIELGKMLDEKRIRGKSLVRYLRNQDVQWGYINTEDLPEMDIEISERDRYTIKNGDLLVCEGGDIGRAAIWRGNDNEIGYQKALHRVRPRVNERDTPEFFYFVLVAAKHRGVFNETDNKATIPHLTGEKFRQYRFAFPPIEEQREIVDYLAHIESQYRILKSKLERSTILLDQYRQALITAAVTGQIDVREKMTVSAETISAGKE